MSIDIDAIEARADAATPGPWMWEISEYSACLFGHNQKSDHPLQLIKAPIKSDEFACYWPNAQDAAFIAASRHDVPALCAELRRLRAELADVRAQAARQLDTERKLYERDQAAADLANVRARWAAERDAMVRDWLSDVGTLTAKLQTAEALAARLNTEVGYLLEENEEMGRREMQRAAAARKVAQFARKNMAAMQHVQRAQRERDAARAEAARLRKLANILIGALKVARSKANEIVYPINRALTPERYDDETRAALRGPAQQQTESSDEQH